MSRDELEATSNTIYAELEATLPKEVSFVLILMDPTTGVVVNSNVGDHLRLAHLLNKSATQTLKQLAEITESN